MAFGDIIRSAPSPQDFPRGIGGNANTIWHTSLLDPKNYELSVSDFSVIRQANAPDTKPTDIGGDSEKVWHCDYEAEKVYELSSSDLSIVRTSSSPGTWPSGIGGYSSKIWHGDSDENKVYELSTSDFGVIRSEAAPGIGDKMWGIGGSGSVIWFRSGPDPSTILIYKLSVEDFSVLYSVEAPTTHPGGLGGDTGVIWYCNYSYGEKKVYELESSAPPSAPTELLCNGLTNPVDIIPQYFSAIYNDPDSGDVAKHYRLQVNKESDFSGQVVWDSGKTSMSDVNEGERCTNIDYNGRALSLNKIKYYWRIKFWDAEGNDGIWSAAANFTMAGSGAGEAGAGPWEEDVVEPTGEVKVEIPRRSGQWTTLEDVMRIHTNVNKNPLDKMEKAQAEVTVSNISKNFNCFEEASDWYKQLEGYALQLSVGCKVGGTPISRKLFTGIISAVDVDRLSQTAEIKVVDFLDYFGRVTIEQTPVWQNISLTQLYKNLVELAFPEWEEGVDYFVEDLGDITVPAIGYEDLNLLSELKMIAESRGMRIFTDVNGKLVCRSRNLEGEAWDIRNNYNLESVRERRDIDNVLNWIIVHARPHEVAYEPTTELDVLGPDVTPPGKVAVFTGTPGDQKIDLSWLNPTDDDFDKVRVCFSATAYPLNEEDGTQIYEGTGESKSHTGLTNGKRYYYSAFTKDTTGNWSDATHTSAVAGAGGDTWEDDMPPSRVSAFRAEPESQKIILTWYNPNIANFDKVVIRRSTTSYPDSPTSGSSVYEGTAETTTDTGLANGTKYYYSAFVKNTAGDYSGAAFASAETPSLIRTKQLIQSQNITGYSILGPQTGAYGTSYSKKVLLRFGGLKGKYSTDWLRFKHEWDIKVNSGPKYSSNQKHEYGAEDALALDFTKNIGGVAGVTVTKIRVTTSEVQVEYKLVYIGGKALSISFSNKLSLWG